MKKQQITLEKILAYIQGNLRYKVYYTKLNWILRRHIREQIAYRIIYMNSECYNSGSCIKCGCQTTALQMADKPCDGSCYPEMMNKKDWDKYKAEATYLTHNGYLDSKGIKWLLREDYTVRYNARTLQNDILEPNKQQK